LRSSAGLTKNLPSTFRSAGWSRTWGSPKLLSRTKPSLKQRLPPIYRTLEPG
jgi:hypothetical protein